MKRQFKFFTDPGHGWLEVPMAEIDRLKLRHKISHYSYRKVVNGTDYAYLEEDCDAGEFIRAFGEENMEIVWVYLENEAAIRCYNRFC